jgi:hypothetical protein
MSILKNRCPSWRIDFLSSHGQRFQCRFGNELPLPRLLSRHNRGNPASFISVNPSIHPDPVLILFSPQEFFDPRCFHEEVQVIFKGGKGMTKVFLHHYRLADAAISLPIH